MKWKLAGKEIEAKAAVFEAGSATPDLTGDRASSVWTVRGIFSPSTTSTRGSGWVRSGRACKSGRVNSGWAIRGEELQSFQAPSSPDLLPACTASTAMYSSSSPHSKTEARIGKDACAACWKPAHNSRAASNYIGPLTGVGPSFARTVQHTTTTTAQRSAAQHTAQYSTAQRSAAQSPTPAIIFFPHLTAAVGQ